MRFHTALLLRTALVLSVVYGNAGAFAPLNAEAVAKTPTNDHVLRNIIQAEATQMDIFPEALALYRVNPIFFQKQRQENDRDFERFAKIANGAYHGYYEGHRLLERGLSYDLTFDRYLAFYRFKTAACYATPEEIDECVAKFNEMAPKERALVLVAIRFWREAQIYSDYVRRMEWYYSPGRVHSVGPDIVTGPSPLYPILLLGERAVLPGNYTVTHWEENQEENLEKNKKERYYQEKFYRERVPRYIIRNGCLLPVDVPEFSVDAATEERWTRLIESCVGSEEIAFEQLDLDLEETKRAWEADCRERLAEVGELFNVELPEWHVAQRFKNPDSMIYYSYAERFFERDKLNVGGDELRYWEALTAFFDAVEAQKKAEPQSEATRRAVALQEFWFACQRTAPVGDETPKDGLQSARPLTLGEIAKDCLPLQTPARQELRKFSKSDGPIIEAFTTDGGTP